MRVLMRDTEITTFIMVVVIVFTCFTAFVRAADDFKINYYKHDGVGAFEIIMQLPADVDMTSSFVRARSVDEKVYLVFEKWPDPPSIHRNLKTKLTVDEQNRVMKDLLYLCQAL